MGTSGVRVPGFWSPDDVDAVFQGLRRWGGGRTPGDGGTKKCPSEAATSGFVFAHTASNTTLPFRGASMSIEEGLQRTTTGLYSCSLPRTALPAAGPPSHHSSAEDCARTTVRTHFLDAALALSEEGPQDPREKFRSAQVAPLGRMIDQVPVLSARTGFAHPVGERGSDHPY